MAVKLVAVKLVAVVSLTQVVRAHLAETNKGKNIFCLVVIYFYIK